LEWTNSAECVASPDLNLESFGIEYMDSWNKALAIQ
jgi:hypothetical protein